MPKIVLFGFCRRRQRMPLDQLGVRLALAAIEGVRAFAALELAGEHVPADAVARRQIVKVRVPADLSDLALRSGRASRAPAAAFSSVVATTTSTV